MAKAQVYKANDPKAPQFPANFKVIKRAVLQKTDIADGKNNNKYYNVELHDGGTCFRVFTHYGRTDDLETKGANAGVKECRFFSSLSAASSEYDSIYREKTGPKKGYQELALASTKVGSQVAQGMSSGHIDEKTKERLNAKDDPEKKAKAPPVSTLPSVIRELVACLYQEATGALVSSAAKVQITGKGVETPLGILTIGQIEKGEDVLKRIYEVLKSGAALLTGSGPVQTRLAILSSEFYQAVPHKIGRTKESIAAAIIKTLQTVEEKQELLQLMRDMLVVSGDKQDTLVTDDVDQKYQALGCELVEVTGTGFAELHAFVMKSQIRSRVRSIERIYTVKRNGEHEVFEDSLGNHKKLFHGSRAKNWMGLLSRGILLPKIVQTMGVNRTDAGWLGNGLYFGDSACTPVFYTSNSRRGTRFMAVAQVALGKVKDYTKITYGIEQAPKGFDSCHGVRRKSGVISDFEDDEFVIYRTTQQKMLYLVEFNA
jgi:predicted DNA-binding WGR domain protein